MSLLLNALDIKIYTEQEKDAKQCLEGASLLLTLETTLKQVNERAYCYDIEGISSKKSINCNINAKKLTYLSSKPEQQQANSLF